MSSSVQNRIKEKVDYIYQRLRSQLTSLEFSDAAHPNVFYVLGASVSCLWFYFVCRNKHFALGWFSKKENLSNTLVCDNDRCLKMIVSFLLRNRWLYRDGLLPENIHFIGYARSQLTIDKVFQNAEKYMKVIKKNEFIFSNNQRFRLDSKWWTWTFRKIYSAEFIRCWFVW